MLVLLGLRVWSARTATSNDFELGHDREGEFGEMVGESPQYHRHPSRRGLSHSEPCGGLRPALDVPPLDHCSAHAAKHATLARCPGPQARLWACGTTITIAVARGPRGAFACHWADPRLPTHATTGALARCQATYPPDAPDRYHVWRSGPRRAPRRAYQN